jgi:LacI family transcriptional regulator
VTEHLIGLGHRAIGFIRGLDSHVSTWERLQGYREALDAHGIAFDPDLVVAGENSFTSGGEAAGKLLERVPRPTAIFAGNDDMAAGVLAVAHEADIDVPGELSIVGFDDSDLAKAVWPPLTTMRQPVRELAYAAADLMLSPETESRVTLEHKLMVRSTTGPAPR